MRSTVYRFGSAAVAFAILSLTACAGHGPSPGMLPGGGTMQGRTLSVQTLSRSSHAMRELTLGGIQQGAAEPSGAGYPVTAEPPVEHPAEAPCKDLLFNPNTPPIPPETLPVGEFGDYADHLFNYSPPADCPGPYAKIILKVHFRVSAGIQYDRTGAIWVGGTNIFFGTTAEPAPNASPQWQLERDVTEYAPIFASASTGQASVYNIVNSTYTGIIYGTAELDFYPATSQYPAARVADAVYPLANSSTGGYVYLDGPTNQMSGTFTFPRNVDQAYLDVFLESQSGDEFWYTCFPNDLAQKLNNCGGTGFREGEVYVDGQPAGVAPIYPWIYSGGIDPYLWVPMPGVETLDFKPYRVNLTPFAASLDDGNPHTISVAVFNDNNYFAANGALVVFEDHGSTQVTGALTRNGTAYSPVQNVLENVKFDSSGNAKGTIRVTATHPVVLDGYVMTSAGRVETRVQQTVKFSNVQSIVATSSEFLQDIAQQTSVASQTDTISGGKTTTETDQRLYPLGLDYSYIVNPAGTQATQTTTVSQVKSVNTLATGVHISSSTLQNSMQAHDVLTYTSSGATPSNGKSRQEYKTLYSGGQCYDKILTSLNYVLTGTTYGC